MLFDFPQLQSLSDLILSNGVYYPFDCFVDIADFGTLAAFLIICVS